MDDDTRELRSPQEVTTEKAILLLIKNDPPKTRYRLDYHRLVMGRGEYVNLVMLTPIEPESTKP